MESMERILFKLNQRIYALNAPLLIYEKNEDVLIILYKFILMKEIVYSLIC